MCFLCNKFDAVIDISENFLYLGITALPKRPRKTDKSEAG